jgi:hypothetical protein
MLPYDFVINIINIKRNEYYTCNYKDKDKPTERSVNTGTCQVGVSLGTTSKND